MGESGADVAPLVDAHQLRVVFDKGRFTFPASVFNATCYTLIVWRDVPHTRQLVWLGMVACMAAVRLVVRATYRRRPREVAETARWARISVLSGAANGLVWGSVALLAYPHDSASAQMLQTIVLAASTGVAGAISAAHPPTYLAFALPTVTPLVVRLFAQGDMFHAVLAVMLIVFAAQMGQLARSTARALRDASELRFQLAALNRTLEARVAERTAALEDALALRDEFLMVASHELRTPVASMLLSVENLQLAAADAGSGAQPAADLPRGLGIIARQSQHLSRLINQLLDVSRIEAQRLELTLEAGVDLGAVVRAAVARLEWESRRAGCEVAVTVSGDVVSRCDPGRIDQAVTNLLTNALKFGRGHPVAVTVAATGGGATIAVKDGGIGIAPELQAMLFERFQRGVSSRNYGGLGLGLYIARQIVEAHGGSITVASAVDAGAELTIRLPA
jgi:signal transduction histidine kinase